MSKGFMGKEEAENLPVEAKLEQGRQVILKALQKNDSRNTVIGFTGGKDSTLTAWLVKQVCEKENIEKPDLMFVDHGQHFDELEKYVDRISEEWGFEVQKIKNDDLISEASNPGDKVSKSKLGEINRKELERLNEDEVPWLMDTKAGNHLLKTVPMQEYIRNNDIEAVINGVRWDEHDSRSDEDYFSPRDEPSHTRIHPILPLTEKEVWEATWRKMIPDTTSMDPQFKWPETPQEINCSKNELPVCPLYWEGYRSLGSEVSTEKSEDRPAWLQDLENTEERQGRAQNKDEKEIMEKLRNLGYM